MKHAAHETSKLRTIVDRGLWFAVLGVTLSLPAFAGERTPRPNPASQAPSARVAVPRGSVDSTPPSSAQRQPTARDTRRIPPGQYRRPSPPAPGRPPAHGGYHYRGYYPIHGYPYYSWYGWGWWGPYGYGAPYWWADPAPAYRIRYMATDLGGLDLNVKPKKAAVYVDGQYVGMAKDFDGYPGYLWLEKGTYELSLAMPGYQTFRDDFEIRPGRVIDVRLRLAPGVSTPPGEPAVSEPRPKAPASESRPPVAETPAEMEIGSEPTPQRSAGEVEAPGQSGRLHFLIQPSDASVYLDGRLLGSGGDLGGLHAGMIVEAGRHRLEIVRPGYLPQSLEIFVESDGELELKIKLNEDSR